MESCALISSESTWEAAVNDHYDAPKLATDVPDPPAVTDEVRTQLAAEAREWGAEFSKKVSAIESVTAEDLRARAR